jgi:hypothetical protein
VEIHWALGELGHERTRDLEDVSVGDDAADAKLTVHDHRVVEAALSKEPRDGLDRVVEIHEHHPS